MYHFYDAQTSQLDPGVGIVLEYLYQQASTLLGWFHSDYSLASETTVVGSFFIGLAVFILLEWRYPFIRSTPKATIRAYYHNATIFLFNNLTVSLLSITSLYLIAQQFANNGLAEHRHYSIAEWFLLLIVVDFSMYLWHVANHKISWLWMFHKVHHSDQHMNASTAIRFHVGELILTVLFKCALIILLGISEKIIIATQVLITWFTFFHHTNVSFEGEKRLSKIIIVPYLHRLHHSSRRIEHDSNFGSVFSIWDRLFGTLKEGIIPAEIGLQAVTEQNLWESFKFGLSAHHPVPAFELSTTTSEVNNTANLTITNRKPVHNSTMPSDNEYTPTVPRSWSPNLGVNLYFSYLHLNLTFIQSTLELTQSCVNALNDTSAAQQNKKRT